MELTDGTFTATREFRFTVGRAEKGETCHFEYQPFRGE